MTPERFGGDDYRKYVEALARVSAHRRLLARFTLTDHVRLHRLMMTVFGRLIDFSGLWERDLYFVTLALMHREGLPPDTALTEMFETGQILKAHLGLTDDAVERIRPEITRHFGDVHEPGDKSRRIRNAFAHLDLFAGSSTAGCINLTAQVERARYLMRHDRKLGNAVTKSVIDMLGRAGLTLTWKMNTKDEGGHRLSESRLATRSATHLGGRKLPEKKEHKRLGRKNPDSHEIRESLHGEGFVGMVAELFAGKAAGPGRGVETLDLERIDWSKLKQKSK